MARIRLGGNKKSPRDGPSSSQSTSSLPSTSSNSGTSVVRAAKIGSTKATKTCSSIDRNAQENPDIGECLNLLYSNIDVNDDGMSLDDDEYARNDVYAGSVRSDIVGLRFYTGFISRGEIVLLKREPDNPYDRNAIRIDNMFGAQIGHIKREMAAFLSPLIDEKLIRIIGRVPCNKNTYSMPVDLGVYVSQDNLVEVKKKFHSGHHDLSSHALFSGKSIKQTLVANLKHPSMESLPGSEGDFSFTSNTEILAEKVMNTQLDKVFEDLRETDKTEQRDPPPFLNKSLYPHQKHALAWMYKRENEEELPPFWKKTGVRYENTLTMAMTNRKPAPIRGGILADDMGLGKTIQMISLIISSDQDGRPFPERHDNPATSHNSKFAANNPGAKRKILIDVDDNIADIQSDIPLIAYSNPESARKDKSLSKRRRIYSDSESDNQEVITLSDDEFCLPDLQESPLKPVKQSKIEGTSAKLKSSLPHGTLIVCPLSVMVNWTDQFVEHLNNNIKLSVYQYYGTNRTTLESLRSKDVVITTYGTVSSCYKKRIDPLFQIEWLRIVLDEAHMIRNPNSQMAQACYALHAERRWVLTGTPIQNKLLDMWSLVRFLQVKPLDDRGFWRVLFERPIARRTQEGFQRLKAFMQGLAMRRTKSQLVDGKPLVDLPPKTVYLERLEFSPDERKMYDVMHKEGKLIVNRYINEGTLLHHYAQVLAILLRLRQICCHPFLVKKAAERARRLGRKKFPTTKNFGLFVVFLEAVEIMESEATDEEKKEKLIEILMEILRSGADEQCAICLDSLQDPVITPCAHTYCRHCILAVLNHPNNASKNKSMASCPLCRREISTECLISIPDEDLQSKSSNENDTMDSSTNSEEWQSSAKVEALMSHLEKIRKMDDRVKCLVVSQFTSFLDIIETPLLKADFKFCRLDGSMNRVQRVDSINDFSSTKPDSPTILLLSLKAGGVGLNLMAATHVFLMEPAWNPAAEDQCFDRCHRLGQTKPVYITKFIIKDSVEERMLELQERKRELMNNALTVDKVDTRQQRINDIRMLMS